MADKTSNHLLNCTQAVALPIDPAPSLVRDGREDVGRGNRGKWMQAANGPFNHPSYPGKANIHLKLG
jgi:hypothetical protein